MPPRQVQEVFDRTFAAQNEKSAVITKASSEAESLLLTTAGTNYERSPKPSRKSTTSSRPSAPPKPALRRAGNARQLVRRMFNRSALNFRNIAV